MYKGSLSAGGCGDPFVNALPSYVGPLIGNVTRMAWFSRGVFVHFVSLFIETSYGHSPSLVRCGAMCHIQEKLDGWTV